MPGSVLIGNVNPGLVTSDYMKAILDFMQYDAKNRNVFRGYLPWRASSLIDIYRNMICEQFLMELDADNNPYEWLLFVDSDVEINNSTLYSMLDIADPDSFPVVSGIYPTIDEYGKSHPSLWYRGLNKDNRMTMIQYESLDDIELIDDSYYSVDGVGAGCLLIHRSLLELMRTIYPPAKPWFDMETFDGIPYGEDYTFCMRVKGMGLPIIATPHAIVNHYKEIKLGLPLPKSLVKEKVTV